TRWISPVRPSRQLLHSFLRMRDFLNPINDLLILRRPQGGRLEGRTIVLQPAPQFFHTLPSTGHPIRHFVSGLSNPSVSSSENWCRNRPGGGETETSERASASRIGWRNWPSHERKLSRAPL